MTGIAYLPLLIPMSRLSRHSGKAFKVCLLSSCDTNEKDRTVHSFNPRSFFSSCYCHQSITDQYGLEHFIFCFIGHCCFTWKRVRLSHRSARPSLLVPFLFALGRYIYMHRQRLARRPTFGNKNCTLLSLKGIIYN